MIILNLSFSVSLAIKLLYLLSVQVVSSFSQSNSVAMVGKVQHFGLSSVVPHKSVEVTDTSYSLPHIVDVKI